MTDKCPFCDAGRIGESRTFGCLTYCDENDGHLRSRECERRGHQKQIDALELELDSIRQLLADIPEYAGLSESETALWEDKPHVLVRRLREERDAAIAARDAERERCAGKVIDRLDFYRNDYASNLIGVAKSLADEIRSGT